MTVEFRQREDTYLAEERYEKPKEVFKLARNLIAPLAGGNPAATLLDMGCATGEFIYYLRQEFPGFEFTGVDNSATFIEKAGAVAALRGCAFHAGDALAWRGARRFDIVCCFGVAGIFDDFEPLFENLLANARTGGRVFVQALFNDDDIDVRVAYRDNVNGKDWNKGFNIFSAARVSRWLAARELQHEFHRFTMPVDLARRQQLPHRAWTVRLEDGERRTLNGMCIMLPEKVLEIRVLP